jgi:hypothetical protein
MRIFFLNSTKEVFSVQGQETWHSIKEVFSVQGQETWHSTKELFSVQGQETWLVEETRVPGENNRPTASHRQTFPLIGFEQSFSDDRNCIGSYKSNYHTITTQHSGR